MFHFWKESHSDYIQYNGTLPAMTSFTMCVWLSPSKANTTVDGSIMSYCTKGAYQCNVLWMRVSGNVFRVMLIGDLVVAFRNVPLITARSHVCVVMSSRLGTLRYYLNGTEPVPASNTTKEIPQGGVMIIGQDQDGPINGTKAGGPQQLTRDRFQGRMEGWLLWDRALFDDEIAEMYQSGCNCNVTDAIIAFNSSNSIVKGHMTTYWNYTC